MPATAKTPRAPAAKTKTKTAAAAPAPGKKPAPAAAEPDAKPRKPKLVRDGFTMPKDEYAAIDALKQRAAALARPAKKSELLRAGLKLLAGLDDAALLVALQAVPAIKTGRPKAAKK
ncbi:MAG: hypothetical protein BGO13_07595 [Burkholderiales bacterium 66-5]|jgi:hypothetical protein|uniref:hypothetical protein n=1 Tax=Comamonas TaxID=283 RepID=UPI00041C05B6|nr:MULTISPECIES: hypothetical protein [Comamonas]ODS90475.1 MAG: hypothetical protein ABS45_15590 [Comamonas sp. SCN 65-56]OJU92748.1 MAG: hypothetical protein BGO13_07595 [Burkholderiales bacterium 66-5]